MLPRVALPTSPYVLLEPSVSLYPSSTVGFEDDQTCCSEQLRFLRVSRYKTGILLVNLICTEELKFNVSSQPNLSSETEKRMQDSNSPDEVAATATALLRQMQKYMDIHLSSLGDDLYEELANLVACGGLFDFDSNIVDDVSEAAIAQLKSSKQNDNWRIDVLERALELSEEWREEDLENGL